MPTLTLNTPAPTGADAPEPWRRRIREHLVLALRQWWNQETTDWDALVEGGDTETFDPDLWGSMPTVDSKAVARTSPIFEEHLGRPLDISLIRPGGYDSAENMIRHLVPAMMDASQARRGIRAVKQEVAS